MIPFVLNEKFEIIARLDTYSSLEWVNRYNDAGDFILQVPASTELLSILQPRYYLVREDDEMIGVIEKLEVVTNVEIGNQIIASGRSIESILGRRVVWNQTNANTTIELFLRKLIDENCINPTDPARVIPNLMLGELRGFTETIEKQVTGDNLLNVIREVCQSYNYGFRIYMNADSKLVFDIYKGTDRSYNQSINPYVLFTPKFDNILSSEYIYDESNYSNVALIGGEGEGIARRFTSIGTASGIDRYESFVDARDVSSNDGEISTAEYTNLLAERGYEALSELTMIESFTGEVETSLKYIYKTDYYLGDVVNIENEYGLSSTPRITGVIESFNENGYRIVPTFSTWNVEEVSR